MCFNETGFLVFVFFLRYSWQTFLSAFKLEDDHSHRFVDRLCYRRSINDNFNSIKQLNIMTSKNKCCVSFYVRKTCFVNGVNCSRQQERNPIKLPNTLSNLKYFQARFLVFNFFMLFWQPEYRPVYTDINVKLVVRSTFCNSLSEWSLGRLMKIPENAHA